MAISQQYIPLYPNWIELMETKDTDEKQLAFIRGIIDAFRGDEPPSPKEMQNPRGTDYARRDGYLVALPMVGLETRRRGGQPGNQNARKTNDKTNENESENDEETNEATNETNFNKINKNKSKNKSKLFSLSKERHTPFLDETFDKFWSAYPSSCPRKTDKRKCRAKWETIFKGEQNPDALFKAILDGLAKWSKCETWTSDGGKFIRAPLVWLNNRNWEDAPVSSQDDEAELAQERYRKAEQDIKDDLRRKGLM